MKKRDSSRQEGKSMDYKAALQRAAGLCSRQEQCSSHIRNKLREWSVSDDDADKVIRKLEEEKFLDDSRYAGFYAKDKFRFNGWGKVKISHMMRQKQISGEEIEKALSQIDEEDYFVACLRMVRTKSASLKENNLYTRKGKLFRFATSRGFEPDLIHRAINELEKE